MDGKGQESYDVVVVGAGLSGLRFAHKLLEDRTPKPKVVVLEAANRVGGRIYSDPDFGIDLGPAWIWPGAHPRIHRLCKTLKVPVFKQPGASPFENQNRIEGGIGRVVDLVAKGVKAHDGDIRLEHAVNGIEETADGVVVKASSKGSDVSFSAKAVVVTTPPRITLKDIKFTPPLSAAKTKAINATPTWMSKCSKVAVLYDSQFWPAGSVNGGARTSGPAFQFYDGTSKGQAAIVAFCQGADMSTEELQKGVAEQVNALPGIRSGPPDKAPTGFLTQRWETNPLINEDASDSSMWHLHANRFLGEQHGKRVFFAGSESSQEEPGFIEGALVAAEQAVIDVEGLLG